MLRVPIYFMNILEWLSLVVPALFFAVVIFQFLHRKFRSYFIIVLGGLLLIGGGFYLITILLDYSLAYQRQNCIASRELYECLGKRYIIAYPIILIFKF